jgi:hypothetical protein
MILRLSRYGKDAQGLPSTNSHRAPLFLPLAAKHLPSSVLALVQVRAAYTDHLIADFSRASPPRL